MTMYLTVGSSMYPRRFPPVAQVTRTPSSALCTLGLTGLGSSEAFISTYMDSPAEPELGGTWSGRKTFRVARLCL